MSFVRFAYHAKTAKLTEEKKRLEQINTPKLCKQFGVNFQLKFYLFTYLLMHLLNFLNESKIRRGSLTRVSFSKKKKTF